MSEPQPEQLDWMFSPVPEFHAVALSGSLSDAEDVIAFPYSQVRSWAAPSRRLSQAEMETWHLAQINADHFAATNIPFVPNGWCKNERPDFLLRNITSGQFEVGLEFAAFTPEQRREVEATAIRIRGLLQKHEGRFEHLAGCRVMLGAAHEESYDPSPAALNRELQKIDDVIEAIAGLERPNSLAVGDFSGGFPQQLPMGLITDARVGNVVAHCQEHVPRELAINHYLFRQPIIHLIFTLHETIASLRTQIQRVVQKHDYKGVNTLVLTAGAPDRFGYGYIEDEQLLNFVLERSENLDCFGGEYFQQVIVHFWSSGDIRQVFPIAKSIVEGLPPQHRMQTVVNWDAGSGQLRGVRPGALVL